MKNIIFKVKATEEQDGVYIEGYATNYNVPDRTKYKDCLIHGCFKKSLNEKTVNEDIIVSLMHDRTNAVGKIIELDDRPEGLWVKIKISDAEDKLKTKVLEGIYNKLSLGFLEVVSKSKQYNDNAGNLLRNEIKEAKLIEIAIVKRSGDPEARFKIAEKMMEIIESEEYETEEQFIEKIKSLVNEPPHSEPPLVPEPPHSENKPIDYQYLTDKFKLN